MACKRAAFRGTGFDEIGNRRQVFPEELAAIEHAPSAHVEEIDRQHVILVVIAEDVSIVALNRGHALLFMQLLHGRDQVPVLGGQLIVLLFSR